MGFQDNLPGIHTRAFNQVSIDCVYSPVADDPYIFDQVSCKITIEYDVVLQPSGYDAQVIEVGTTITALYPDVKKPQFNSTFETADKIFTVQKIIENDKIFVKMTVSEAEI